MDDKFAEEAGADAEAKRCWEGFQALVKACINTTPEVASQRMAEAKEQRRIGREQKKKLRT